MTLIETWLTRATTGLSDEAADQVRTEIGEHYRSSYSDLLARGRTGEEAERVAVASLGDPQLANRQYRRVLLTVREAKYLRMLHPPDSLPYPPGRITLGKWLAGVIFAEVFVYLGMLAWKQNPLLFVFLPLFANAVAGQFLPINTPLRGRIYRWIKWAAFIGATVLAVWYEAKPVWAPAIVLFVPAYHAYMRMSIRRKLPTAQWPRRLYQ